MRAKTVRLASCSGTIKTPTKNGHTVRLKAIQRLMERLYLEISPSKHHEEDHGAKIIYREVVH